jgi:excisionase family DNA binding protein
MVSRTPAHPPKGGTAEYYTVAQAAQLLQVSPSTVWRWIERGTLAAYRVGPKAMRIRKQDLALVIQPAARPRKEMKEEEPNTTPIQPGSALLSDDEVRRGFAALQQAKASRAQQLARRGGKPLSSSVELIHQVREELSARR